MSYVYREVHRDEQEPPIQFEVGFWHPADAYFEHESWHDHAHSAAERVHYLNGGMESHKVNQLIRAVDKLATYYQRR